MSALIGIDLGTSTTEAAIYRDGKKEMILNLDGKAVTPSAVGIDSGGNWVVGERARAQYLLSPENTAVEVKRKMGTGESVALGKIKYSPVDLQARLLSYVRTYASEYLGENVERAVISVPAYFNDIQRRETILAGERAGFSVERILNEPTAAALSYGLDHMDEESHILVYDLGGGTFDVTLLEMFDGVLEVKASSGDNQLGGKDFDEKLMDLLFKRFQDKHGVDLRGDQYAVVRIKEEAEKCKITLSEQDACHVLIPAVRAIEGKPVELDETVTREEFEELCRELLQRTHHPIDVVLDDAGISENEINRIILVGGSTRMPMVSRDIEKYLEMAPETAVNPDYAVAEGAAIQAGMISGEIRSEDSLVMTDVNPYTLGIRVMDGLDDNVMSVIIPRNVTIPVTRTERYSTSAPYQTEAKIEAYQGESRIASHNHPLGNFMFKGIPPRPAGTESLDVRFSYDLNGILNITAVLVSTGKEASMQIDMAKGAENMPDLSKWKEAAGAKAYRAIIRTAERLISGKGGDLPFELREKLRETLDELKRALVQGNPDDAEDASEALSELVEAARSMRDMT